MKKHYILLKIHNTTGLKYLCKHVTQYESTCYSYPGSGVYWKRHLEKHGNDVSTEILKACNTLAEAKEVGEYYSTLWNVVESTEFANLVTEQGQGGAEPVKFRKNHPGWRGLRLVGDDNPAKRLDVREKISQKLKGRIFNDETKKKLSEAKKGKEPWNKGKPNPYAQTAHMNIKVTCPHCLKEGPKGAMMRWHFENCKKK